MAGLAASFGSGAMSNSMDDVAEQAQALFIIGSNTTEQHPVFGDDAAPGGQYSAARS
ncbi:MAG: hypothetical protein MZV70_17310 [Desulfobacterales bacterium]|nr:hypothetical protein [Desulfobacterales bacterium]